MYVTYECIFYGVSESFIYTKELYANMFIVHYIINIIRIHTFILFRLRNAQDQLIHLKHEEDELNKVLDEDEAQINKITELISVVEMWVVLFANKD